MHIKNRALIATHCNLRDALRTGGRKKNEITQRKVATSNWFYDFKRQL